MAEATRHALLRIRDAVVTALQGITLAGGYAVSVESVVVPRRNGFLDLGGNKTVLGVSLGAGGRHPFDDAAGDPLYAARWRDFAIDICLLRADSAALDIDAEILAVEGAVQKSLMADPTLGGLALPGSELTDVNPLPDYLAADGVDGFTMTFRAVYRTAENDPHT